MIPGTSYEVVEVSEAASFIYDQLQNPRTMADLTSICLEQFGPNVAETSARIGATLRALVERGLAMEIPPGAPVPIDPHRVSKDLLRQAEQRLRAGDWPTAVALCQEAGKDPAYAAVAKLNGLIARYKGGSFDGVVDEACLLSSQLRMPSQVCCDAMALLAAHQTGDLATAKLVALHLARRVESPWDLPTVPDFAVLAWNQIVVLESLAVEPMLAAIEALLAARVANPDESALLEALARRYWERKAKSGSN